jgi:hypothetical protein
MAAGAAALPHDPGQTDPRKAGERQNAQAYG